MPVHGNGAHSFHDRRRTVFTDYSPVTGDMVFDLETADADTLYSYGPGFVRLAGTLIDGEGYDTTTNVESVVERVRTSACSIGHNIMAFDLPALARHHGLDFAWIHELAENGGLIDTLLLARHLDPPMARDTSVASRGKYSLDTLGETYGLGRKSSDLKALAKEYGGFDQIPVGDGRYTAYLEQDLSLTRELAVRLCEGLAQADEEYLAREHRVAALAAQMTHNGFRVDTDLLNERIDEIAAEKTRALTVLNETYAIPLTDAHGRRAASPLATKAGKDALANAFTHAGVEKLWRTAKTGDITTSAEAMDALIFEHQHNKQVVGIADLVKTVVTSRTVYTTISDNLVGDRVHPRVSMWQSTGRWSLTKPGLTVIGKHGRVAHERDVFLPDPGERLVTADLAQVDMRAVAGLSQDSAYIEMLATSDPHTEVARTLLGDRGKRYEAKAIGHGWNYGRGIRAISEGNDISPATVTRFDQMMRQRFPRLVQWQDEVRELAACGALLNNGFGRWMRPDPVRAHTQGPALMGQGAARDIMMEGLLRLPGWMRPMVRAQVHDEVVCSVPLEYVDDARVALSDALNFEWKGVPIMAEVSEPAHSWGAVYRE